MIFSVVLACSALFFKFTYCQSGDSLYFDFFDRDYNRNSRSENDSDEDFTQKGIEEHPFEVSSPNQQPNFRTSKFLTSRKVPPGGITARKDDLTFPNLEQLFGTSGNDVNVFDTAAPTTSFHSNLNDYIYTHHNLNLNGYKSKFVTHDPPEVVKLPSYVAYIEKIDLPRKERPSTTTRKPPEMDATRYQEVVLTTKKQNTRSAPSSSGSNKRIEEMLKNYLASLVINRYGAKRKKNSTIAPVLKNHWKYDEQESKFLFGDALWELKNKTITKIKQFLSIFTVVKFNNTECNSTNWSGTWQGVCLTPSECTQASGMALGDCASGYGVCCVFRGSCGDSTSRNCSYFKSPNYPDYYPGDGGVATPTTTTIPTTRATPDPRKTWWHYRGDLALSRQSTSDATSCIYSVYKTNPDVQRFRIDFIDLDLSGPTNGSCVNEMLVISGQNTNDRIPVLCGYNTGQHVYIDVSELTGPLQIMVLSTTGTRKRFKIRICQYTDSCLTSQSNCLQYYTGTSGVIQSFNYDQAAMFNRSVPGYFNNLNYAICIRREPGYCTVTFTNSGTGGQTYPFQLVNSLPNGQLTVPAGQAGVDVLNCPDDYVIIDGTRLCGDRFNDGSAVTDFSMNAPVIDSSAGPIIVTVRTNGNVTGLGFKLTYTQNRCTNT